MLVAASPQAAGLMQPNKIAASPACIIGSQAVRHAVGDVMLVHISQCQQHNSAAGKRHQTGDAMLLTADS